MTWSNVMLGCVAVWGVGGVLLGGGMAVRWAQARLRR